MRYIANIKVKKVERVRKVARSYKRGDEVVIEEIDQGWFVQFEGSSESLYFGMEPPDFLEGDTVIMTFEKVTQCQISQPTSPTNTPSS